MTHRLPVLSVESGEMDAMKEVVPARSRRLASRAMPRLDGAGFPLGE